jgi:protein arginine N-methyltransferase 1
MGRIEHHRPGYSDTLGLGQFKKSYHLEMIADQLRTSAIIRALAEVLRPEKIFCELGCGTGIFSIFAARRARKVFAVEIDPHMVQVARSNIAESGVADRIELIAGDASAVELPESADVIFCEMMSIWAIEEPQIPVFNNTHPRMLKLGGLFLPQRIINLVELGFYQFEFHGVEVRATVPLFAGITPPAIMTESRVARELDFSRTVSTDLGCEVELEAVAGGCVNCARLTSVVQMGPGVVFSGSDSLMPPTIVPLEEDVVVRPGDTLLLKVSAHARSDLGEAIFSAVAKR